MLHSLIKCPKCGSKNIVKYGISESGKQRYFCRNHKCIKKSFQIDHIYNGCSEGIEEQIIILAENSKGIREISRTLNITTNKVMDVLKKERNK